MTPSPTARTGVPRCAAKSTPVCGKLVFRIGWKRDSVKCEVMLVNSRGKRKKDARQAAAFEVIIISLAALLFEIDCRQFLPGIDQLGCQDA